MAEKDDKKEDKKEKKGQEENKKASSAEDKAVSEEKADVAAAPKAKQDKKGAEKAPGGEEKGAAATDDEAKEKAASEVKVRVRRQVSEGMVHIKASFNNTIITISDNQGKTLVWSSGGKMGFKGSRKSTAYAGQVVSQDACRQAMSHGLKEVEIRVKGPGAGRESAVRAVQGLGLDILGIKDVTPIPHNGCRPKKARRV